MQWDEMVLIISLVSLLAINKESIYEIEFELNENQMASARILFILLTFSCLALLSNTSKYYQYLLIICLLSFALIGYFHSFISFNILINMCLIYLLNFDPISTNRLGYHQI